MSFDYYVVLAEQKACPKKVNECGLASGFTDGCLVWNRSRAYAALAVVFQG